jgi:hypothetical protein
MPINEPVNFPDNSNSSNTNNNSSNFSSNNSNSCSCSNNSSSNSSNSNYSKEVKLVSSVQWSTPLKVKVFKDLVFLARLCKTGNVECLRTGCQAV